MNELVSYQRNFSELPGLQKAKKLDYVLEHRLKEGHILYGIHVTETSQNRIVDEKTLFFTCYQQLAEHLLKFLYENAVPTAQCPDIIIDACASLKLEDKNGFDSNPAANCG